MKGSCKHLFFAALICAWLSADVSAQVTAEISGTVKDQSGAVLPGVEVTVTQTGTGTSRNAVTNETGSYLLSNLPIWSIPAGGGAARFPHIRPDRNRPASRQQPCG